nr:hypothetical protein [uncultured Mediterraneibacter sp.]
MRCKYNKFEVGRVDLMRFISSRPSGTIVSMDLCDKCARELLEFLHLEEDKPEKYYAKYTGMLIKFGKPDFYGQICDNSTNVEIDERISITSGFVIPYDSYSIRAMEIGEGFITKKSDGIYIEALLRKDLLNKFIGIPDRLHIRTFYEDTTIEDIDTTAYIKDVEIKYAAIIPSFRVDTADTCLERIEEDE